jgi:hypothetical protein
MKNMPFITLEFNYFLIGLKFIKAYRANITCFFSLLINTFSSFEDSSKHIFKLALINLRYLSHLYNSIVLDIIELMLTLESSFFEKIKDEAWTKEYYAYQYNTEFEASKS